MKQQFATFRLLLFDIISLNVSLIIIYLIRFQSGLISNPALLHADDIVLVMFALTPPWLIIMLFAGLYKRRNVVSRTDELMGIFKAGSIAAILLFISTYESNNPNSNRMILYLYWLFTIGFLGIERIIFRIWQRRQMIKGIGLKNAVVVGSGAKGMSITEKIIRHPEQGLKLTGVITLTDHPINEPPASVRILGKSADIEKIIHRHQIHEVIIALEESSRSENMKVIDNCYNLPVDIHVSSDLYDIASGSSRTDQVFGIPMIEIRQHPGTLFQFFLKRLFDILFALLIFVFGLPLWVICGLLIRLDSKGPVFYRQKRVGKNGKVFEIYKFRTMTKDAEKSGPALSSETDPRVTGIGRILRNTHIDEFPQIINVIEGNMSFVGPRPERPFYIQKYVTTIPLYARRLKVRPGITGWAQVKQTYEKSVSEIKTKLAHDLFYIENFSFVFDLKIILLTLNKMFFGRIHKK